jgi:DNA polymerase
MNHVAASEMVTAVQRYVRYLQQLGITELPVVLPMARRLTATEIRSLSPVAVAPQAVSAVTVQALPAPPVALAVDNAAERLARLAAEVRECQQCRLHKDRKHVVFGTGDPAAALVFVGEAPGREEDQQGEPFIGEAGQLLTRIIEAIGLKREQVYILNVIKCRPPNNRAPLPDEVAACRPILQAQLASLQPRVVCALGAFAAQALLQTEEKISRLRGRFHRLGDIQVMPTYHPAFLLRNPQYKRQVWEDMQRIQRVLGLKDVIGGPRRPATGK